MTDLTAPDPATERMARSAEITRRSNMFRVYREAGVLQGLLMATVVHENAIDPEVGAALSAMKQLLPYAQERSVGDLMRRDTPESRELLDAVKAAMVEWDARMRRDDPDDGTADP
ncbi:hypothetical protein [Mycobacterium hubeiense]|uniref:hypothetical protein n=1 Tax=Mycobacterium hubeiense TaxID=1867256 RepID=UPI001159D85A|nr:hypothetical protein [Mycobacterium sp. QGD 101]